MKNFLIIVLCSFVTACYSQQLRISSSLNKDHKLPKFWIDIEVFNNTADTLFVTKHPTFGMMSEREMYDCFVEFIDPKTDTVIDIQPKGDYNYLVLGDEIEKVKLAPSESYKFDYYLNVIYDLDPNREYNVCLHWRMENGEKEIISNSLLIPVKVEKKDKK